MERILKDKLPGGSFGPVKPGHKKRMQSIRSIGNKSTERRFRGMLVRAGVSGWKLNPPGLAGKPDVLFPSANLVIFLDGCYWHGCPRCGHVGEVNKPYWSAKIQGNKDRDRRNAKTLRKAGYKVLRLWEHELAESPGACIEAVKQVIAEAMQATSEV